MPVSSPLNAAQIRGKVAGQAFDGTWTVDEAASRVQATTKTLWGMSTVRLSFAGVQGEIAVVDGSVTARIAVATTTLTTRSLARDQHLRSAEFFDSANFPFLTYVLGSATPVAGQIRLAGTLTVRESTRPLSFEPRISMPTKDELCVAAEFTIDRSDYGLVWNSGGVASMINAVSALVTFRRD